MIPHHPETQVTSHPQHAYVDEESKNPAVDFALNHVRRETTSELIARTCGRSALGMFYDNTGTLLLSLSADCSGGLDCCIAVRERCQRRDDRDHNTEESSASAA